MPTVEPDNECSLCIKKRVEAGEPPEQMVVLPNRTRNLELEVRVCPTCDGSVTKIAKSHTID